MIDIAAKKQDLIKYAVEAFDNYAHNRFDESAVQARKSGEAIARLILAKKHTGKIAVNDRTGFKEILVLVKNHVQVPGQILNLLETLQLTGNKASHGSITASDAAYAANALRLLCRYTFDDLLGEAMPLHLAKYMQEQHPHESETGIPIGPVPVKNKPARWMMVVLALMCIAIAAFFLWPAGAREKAKSTTKPVAAKPDLTIGIYNLDIINDNLVVKLDIEQELQAYLQSIAKTNNWRIALMRLNQTAPGDKQALKQACLQQGIQLAIYGSLTENRAGDSCALQLNYLYAFAQQEQPFAGAFKPVNMDTERLTGLQNQKKETAVLMNFGLGIVNYFNGRYAEGYMLTQNLYSSSAYLMTNIYQFNFMSQLALGDAKGSRDVAVAHIRAFPDSAAGYENYATALSYWVPQGARPMDSVLTILSQKAPQSPGLWYLRAQHAHIFTQDTAAAIAYAQKAIALKPGYYEALALAALLLSASDVDKSDAYAGKAIAVNKSRYEAYQVLAANAQQRRQYPGAIAYYKKAAALPNLANQTRAYLYEQAGVCYYQLYTQTGTKVDSVYFYFDRAIAAGSGKTDMIYVNKAALYFKTGDTSRAISNIEKALKVNPGFAYAYEELARHYYKTRQYGRMKKNAELALVHDAQNQSAHFTLGFYYVRVKPDAQNPRAGLSHLNTLLELNPSYPTAWELKGFYYLNTVTNADSAMYCYMRAYKLNPKSVEALYGLAQGHTQKREYTKAIGYLLKCLELDNKSERVLIALTQCYLRLPYNRQYVLHAETYAIQALQLNTGSAAALYNRAQVFLVRNNTAEARNYYNKSVSVDATMRNPALEREISVMEEKLSGKSAN